MDENNNEFADESYLVEYIYSDGEHIAIKPFLFEYFIPTFYVKEFIKNPEIGFGYKSESFKSVSCGRCVQSEYPGWYEIKFYENDGALPVYVELYDDSKLSYKKIEEKNESDDEQNSNYYSGEESEEEPRSFKKENREDDADLYNVIFKKKGSASWPEIRWKSKYYVDDTFRDYKPVNESEKCYYVNILKNKKNQYKILYHGYNFETNKTMIVYDNSKWISKLPRWFLKQFKKNNNIYKLTESSNETENIKLILYALGDTTKIVMEALYEPVIISFQAICRGYLVKKNNKSSKFKPLNKIKLRSNKRKLVIASGIKSK